MFASAHAVMRSLADQIASRIAFPMPNQARNAVAAARKPDPIDVAEVMARFSPSEHVGQADSYFVRDGELAQLLRRPFQDDPSTQQRLYGLSAVLQLAELRRDMRVLDFGCGLGWLSRCLATMGRDMVGVDVSAKALSLATAHLARDPLAEELRVELRHFDSVRLPLEDAAMDRIVSFDASTMCSTKRPRYAKWRGCCGPVAWRCSMNQDQNTPIPPMRSTRCATSRSSKTTSTFIAYGTSPRVAGLPGCVSRCRCRKRLWRISPWPAALRLAGRRSQTRGGSCSIW